jgi:Nif-specific regulatory protein
MFAVGEGAEPSRLDRSIAPWLVRSNEAEAGMKARLSIREPGRVSYTAPVAEPCIIGRDAHNQIVLADRQVSRVHAAIERAGAGHVVRDLDSRHGTFVNGARIQRHELADGDAIQLGNVVIGYRVAGPDDVEIIDSVETLAAVPAGAPSRRLQLLLEVGQLVGADGERGQRVAELVARAVDGLGAEIGVAGLVDRAGGLRRIAHGGELVLPRSVLDALLVRRECLLHGDGGRHGVGAPLVGAGRVLGFLYLARAAPPFGVEDRTFLDLAARLVSAALVQAEREGKLARVAEALREPAGELIGSSPAIVKLRERVERYAAARDAAVLIRGESGTGKGLVARLIHAASPRADGPFVSVNCAAIPDTLIESELFGHEKGAFTGAARALRGKFALAHGGTLFLDEIGDLSAAAQAKVLRAIEEREIQPLGSEEPVEVDVRVLSATHRSLEAEIAAGRFRSDLYYRLAVTELAMPPLRARPGDVLLLADAFLLRSAARVGRPVRGFTPEARAVLVRYGWPGNVRQLANEIERALLLETGELIALEDLQARVGARPHHAALVARTFADAEREAVQRALDEAGGNIRAAARALAVSRNMLYRKLRKHGLIDD